jgi:hypothetical protein
MTLFSQESKSPQPLGGNPKAKADQHHIAQQRLHRCRKRLSLNFEGHRHSDSDGDFDLKTSMGAGIGAGYAEGGVSLVDTIVIRRSHVTRTRQRWAVIGAGDGTNTGNSTANSIMIEQGTVSLSSKQGSGIGCGFAGNSSPSVSSIEIHYGAFAANSSQGTAIGGRFVDSGSETIDRIIADE